MATTKKQEQDFKNTIGNELPLSLLGSVLDWIRDNLNPDEVYDSTRLHQFIGKTAEPDDLFGVDELEQWAINKGFIKPEKKDSILSHA